MKILQIVTKLYTGINVALENLLNKGGEMRAIRTRGILKLIIISALYISCHYQLKNIAYTLPFENTMFSNIVIEASKDNKVHPALVTAIIHAESNFNYKARSRMGAMGLMQINRPTRIALKLNNPYDPKENIYAGTKYLKFLIDKFNGNIYLAIAAYNAGPGNVYKHKGIPPFKETKRYVEKVMQLYDYYKGVES